MHVRIRAHLNFPVAIKGKIEGEAFFSLLGSADADFVRFCGAQFFLELMSVPRIEAKLRVFSFKIEFSAQVEDLKKTLTLIINAAKEVRFFHRRCPECLRIACLHVHQLRLLAPFSCHSGWKQSFETSNLT